MTALAVGSCPAAQFTFDTFGRWTSAANTVRNESAVGSTMVTFDTMLSAVDGIEQLPFDPWTVKVAVSAPSGVARPPTVVGAGRVSTNRHGTIDTSTALSPVSIAGDDAETAGPEGDGHRGTDRGPPCS